jgi:hypothetical protein
LFRLTPKTEVVRTPPSRPSIVDVDLDLVVDLDGDGVVDVGVPRRQGSPAVASGFNSTVNAPRPGPRSAGAVKVHDHDQVNVDDRMSRRGFPEFPGKL